MCKISHIYIYIENYVAVSCLCLCIISVFEIRLCLLSYFIMLLCKLNSLDVQTLSRFVLKSWLELFQNH